MRRIGLGILMAAMLGSGQAVAERSELYDVKVGFITGNQYRSLTTAERAVYVMGWMDGVQISVFFGAPSVSQPGTPLAVLSRCTTDMTNHQIEAIFSKWLGEHPERWHQSSHVLMFVAMNNVCHFPGTRESDE